MSESRHYTGSCHCGAVRYEVDAAIYQFNKHVIHHTQVHFDGASR